MTKKFASSFRRLGTSMYIKIGAMVAVVTITVALFIMVVNQIIIARAVQDGVVALGATATSAFAQNAAPAFTVGDPDRIQMALQQVLDLSQDRALFAVALDQNGAPLAEAGDSTVLGAADLTVLANVSLQTALLETTGDGTLIAAPVILHPEQSGRVIGAIGVVWSSAHAYAAVWDQQRQVYAAAALIFLILSALTAWLLRGMLARPLKQLRDAIQRLAAQDYDHPNRLLGRGDEIGAIARSVDTLSQQLKSMAELNRTREKAQQHQADVVTVLNQALKRMSDGDLTQSIGDSFAPEYESLRRHFNSTHATMVSIIDAVIDSSDRIRSSAEEIAQSSGDLAQRTESQAATLQETAAAMEMLNTGVSSAADAARDVEGIMNTARQTAEGSSSVVADAVEAMSKIEDSSQRITKILGLIDEIAFQTNLLALNAGVEAARAGEAGRGFAVVASEVRALAQRSSDAAQDIKGLITETNNHIGEGVQLVGRTGEELEKLTGRIGTISDHVSDIADSSARQATTLNEINTGVGQLDGVTQHNAAMVEQTTAASQVLRNDASQLARIVAVFKTAATKDPTTQTPPPAAEPASQEIQSGLFEDEPSPVTANGQTSATPQKAVGDWEDF